MVANEVEVVLLCVVAEDTRYGPTECRRHGRSGRAVRLRHQDDIPRVIQSDDCGPDKHASMFAI
mgnify:CR=1 FL=1